MSSDRYHHGNLRAALIEAACQQVEEKGALGLNLSQLARSVGVSQPAVYRHFANKQALTVAVAQYGFEQLTEALHQAMVVVDEGILAGIGAIATTYVTFALEHTELVRLMFSMKNRTTEPELYSTSKGAAADLFSLVTAAHSQNKLRNNDIDKTVRLIWAAIHGLAMLLMDDQMPFVTQTPGELTTHIDAMTNALHRGLFIE